MASQTGAAEQQPGGDALFLLRVARASTQSMAMIFSPSRLRFHPCLPPRTLPAPPHPLWVAHHSLHLSLSLSPFHLPNSQTSPELHLCLHLRAYLLCSHPGLHPCPFPYHPDFTHTTPWLLPCPPASSHRSPGARARSCSTPKLPYWDFLG